MLAFIRKSLTSLPVLILFGGLLVVFAITGVGDPFGSKSAPAGSIARVGGRVITEPQLLQQFERIVRSERQRDPATSQTLLAKQGGVALVAEQLIGSTALEQLAATMGLAASDRAVGAEVAGIAAFQQNGKFDEANYRRVLADNRMSDRDLRSGIAGDLVRKQLITPITAALQVPRGMAEPYVRLLTDQHSGAAAIVPLTAAAAATDAEIAAYYAANKAGFTVPERRAFRYAMIDRNAVAAKAVVTDAQIAAAFAKEPEKYGGAATRTLSQVVVPDEAKARAIAAAAKTEGFAAAAQRLAGFAAADTALGEQSQAKFGAATNAEVAAAAFALPVGGITTPIKSDFGWHVVRVDGLGAAGKTLAAARPAIVADLSQRAADAAMTALVNSIEDGAEAGKSFADLAKANGLTIQTATPLTRDGRAGAGAPDATLAPLAAKAFNREPADGVGVEDLGGGNRAVIETIRVVAAAPQPLADVRAQVAEMVGRAKSLKAAKVKADAVVAAVKRGTSFADAVKAQGLEPPKPLSGRRIDLVNRQNVPGVITAFLQTPVNVVRALPGPGGWVLLHVDTVVAGDAAVLPGILETTRRDLAAQAPAEMAQAFANAAGKAVGVERNAGQINAVARRLSGQADAQ